MPLLLLASGLEATIPSRLARSHTPTWHGAALVQEAAHELGCHSNCSGHGSCRGGQCYCLKGWAGVHCAELSLATSGCLHNCSGHGSCDHRRETCVCDAYHEGPACESAVVGCPNFCQHAGHCVDGTCRCEAGRHGPDCAQLTLASAPCVDECGGGERGTCVAGACLCIPPYRGPSCAESSLPKRCEADCSGHGECDTATGQCRCDAEHVGRACELSAAQQHRLYVIIGAVCFLGVLCAALAGVLAWARFVRGLSWTDMRKGRWEPPAEEGWRMGAATNMMPTARFEGLPSPPGPTTQPQAIPNLKQVRGLPSPPRQGRPPRGVRWRIAGDAPQHAEV